MSKVSRAVFTLLAVLTLAGCNPVTGDNRSVVLLEATFQSSSGTGVVGIFSDVVNNDLTTSDDFFNLSVTSVSKNPGGLPSPLYTVVFEGVQLQYSRPDGRNEPGVDVPFPLRYALGGTVAPNGKTDINLLVVSKEMKLQPPLRNLWFGEGQRIFATVTATIFGHDRVENQVQATASAVVIFGDN